MTELERYKEALEVAQAFICIMRKSGLLSPGRREELALECGGRVDAILNPPPELETVPVERWAIVAPSGYIEVCHSSEETANAALIIDPIIDRPSRKRGPFLCIGIPPTTRYNRYLVRS